MTSTLKIYKTKITPDKNCIVDNLSSYLSSCTKVSISNFQYQRIELDIFIKIQANQSNVGKNELGNYAELIQDNKSFYFFILESNWISEAVVELHLSLDTLNTFNGDFTFSEKTNIIRQHKNRFNSTDKVTDYADIVLHKVVDKTSENISVNLKLKDGNDYKVTESNTFANQNWYLVYRTEVENENTVKPIRTSLVPYDKVPIRSGYVSSRSITKAVVGEGTYYYFIRNDNANLEFIANGNTYNLSDTNTYGYRIIGRTSPATTCELQKYTSSNGSASWSTVEYANTITCYRSDNYRLSTTNYGNMITLINETSTVSYGTGSTGTMFSAEITDINRADSDLVGIIELPYMPCDITWTGNNITLPSGWFINARNEFELSDSTEEFEHTILTNFNISDLTIYESFADYNDMINTSYDKKRESKLLHSDYFDYKLNYDSFSTSIAMERLSDNNNKKLNIDFKPSNAINSELGFKWYLTSPATYKENQDYEHFLISTRNNNVGLYNSEYLNYLRTGYNYDRKTKQNTITYSWLGTGISIVGATIGGIASAGVTGGLSAIAVTSVATAAITNISKSIETQISQEQGLQQKLEEYKQQSASINNANSVDLLNWYNSNKLRIMKYGPTDNMKDLLTKLFHYCGYAIGKQDIPQTNTRTWFNYIQCEPVFTNEDSSTIWDDFKADIKTRFSSGVTYYHNVGGTYDWQQTKENWETSLFN